MSFTRLAQQAYWVYKSIQMGAISDKYSLSNWSCEFKELCSFPCIIARMHRFLASCWDCSNYLKPVSSEWHLFILSLTSAPIGGARLAKGNLWRQNRTRPWELRCLPLIVLVDGSIFMVSMVTHNKCYNFIWHRYEGPATKRNIYASQVFHQQTM